MWRFQRATSPATPVKSLTSRLVCTWRSCGVRRRFSSWSQPRLRDAPDLAWAPVLTGLPNRPGRNNTVIQVSSPLHFAASVFKRHVHTCAREDVGVGGTCRLCSCERPRGTREGTRRRKEAGGWQVLLERSTQAPVLWSHLNACWPPGCPTSDPRPPCWLSCLSEPAGRLLSTWGCISVDQSGLVEPFRTTSAEQQRHIKDINTVQVKRYILTSVQGKRRKEPTCDVSHHYWLVKANNEKKRPVFMKRKRPQCPA